MNHQEFLDPKLQQLYRQLPKEQPSAEVDANIINAAQLASQSKKSWQQPFALAATLTITASLMWYWQAEQPLQLERAVSVKERALNAPRQTPAVETMPLALLQSSHQDSTVIARNEMNEKQQANKKHKELDRTTTAALADKNVIAKAKFDEDVKESVMAEQKHAKASLSLAKNAPAPMATESLPESVSAQMTPMSPSVSIQGATLADRIDARESSAGVIAPQALDISKKAKAEKQSFSAMIEGVTIGMSQAQILTLGFNCQNDVCQKIITHPNQANYWGMSTTNAQLTIFIRQQQVSQIRLTQQQVSLDEVTQQVEQFGTPTERDCSLQVGTVKAKISRIVDGYLLQVRQLGHGVTVSICLAQ